MKQNNWIAPKQSVGLDLAPWEGELETKPWQYPVQLVIPHIGWVAPLRQALELWQRQTIKPYICIIDTGSEWAYVEELETLRAENVELHYLRGHGYRHASAPVSVALDFASARCQQEYQFHTHSDVFPIRQDLLEEFISEVSPECPVVGYQISSREHVKGAMKDIWQGMVGHTATCLHFPTIRDMGITWHLDRGFSQFPGIDRRERSDTDTEIPFNQHLRELGIQPKLMGQDANWVRDITEHFDHCRSFSSSALYSPGYFETARGWIKAAMQDARNRVKGWDDATVYLQQSPEEQRGEECVRDRECGCGGD